MLTESRKKSTARRRAKGNGEANKILPADRPAHDWYRFVLSYPPHLVRKYLDLFGIAGEQTVLDPFSGTGTTIVECKKLGIPSVGVEAHPMPHLAARVKTDWQPRPDSLMDAADKVARIVKCDLDKVTANSGPLFDSADTSEDMLNLQVSAEKLLLSGSISPVPLHKALILRNAIKCLVPRRFQRHCLVALAKSLVSDIGNLHFGPEVGVRGSKEDAPVLDSWLRNVRAMADDLGELRDRRTVSSRLYLHDARKLADILEPESIDAVITSPPYPNEKDYTRTTRLESVLLGFFEDMTALRSLKKNLMRSNTRNVYKDDDDDQWVVAYPRIQRIAETIERRRISLGKTSGFEKLYPRVTKLYFGGMARHFSGMRTALRPGAQLAYVVGDQASYLRVMIRTGEILAEIAESLGYEVTNIDLFRTRLATATKQQLREEVLLLRWPGKPRRKKAEGA